MLSDAPSNPADVVASIGLNVIVGGTTAGGEAASLSAVLGSWWLPTKNIVLGMAALPSLAVAMRFIQRYKPAPTQSRESYSRYTAGCSSLLCVACCGFLPCSSFVSPHYSAQTATQYQPWAQRCLFRSRCWQRLLETWAACAGQALSELAHWRGLHGRLCKGAEKA